MPIKIVIIGPESTGKSTLTQALASYFNEPWVKEYAREYIDQLDRPYEYGDLLAIAQGQIALEEEMATKVNNFLFCDTDLHVLKIWSQHKFGKTHLWTLEQIRKRKYDLYLITDIDIAWEDDAQREHPDPEMRKYFMEMYIKTISETTVPYIILQGNNENRLKSSIDLIKYLFNYILK